MDVTTEATEPPSDEERPDEERPSGKGFLRELPVLIAVALVIAFLLRTFAVQVFYIPSESMMPTLQPNDRIVVEKFSYRFGEPERGDIVVFHGEDDGTSAEQASLPARIARGIGQFLGVIPVDAQDLVKRVIGVPGDRVVVEAGVVTVNGVELDEEYDIPGGPGGTWTVPEGMLFVLGDNRPNSTDSRLSLGYVEIDRVVGRAFVTVWPPSRMGTLEDPEYPEIPASP